MLANLIRTSFISAAQKLEERAEEVNRLNVFPVPDGDTGTNMSLTLKSVSQELQALSTQAKLAEVCKAITHGSLMGARGNSGVITSQILRGLSEGFQDLPDDEALDSGKLNAAFKRSVKVAFQAVRKPVEGTILTVLKDVAARVDACDKAGLSLEETAEQLTIEAFESVARTPEFLPVLKENGVVDAGGFGLAIFFEAFVAAAYGRLEQVPSSAVQEAQKAPLVAIELNDDWEDSEYTYCTEFLVHAHNFDEQAAREYISSMGDCDLLVGTEPTYKVHVHTDQPNLVLGYMLERGEISEVHIHNMKLQSHERTQQLSHEQGLKDQAVKPQKDLAFVAVASGAGNAGILEDLGVDLVVQGGQTMNPSTKDLLEAIEKAPSQKVIVFPNNKNIIMAAQSAASASDKEVAVVPTKSVPQAFSALLVADSSLNAEENAALMTEALEAVHDVEITTAIKDSHTDDGAAISEGDVIAIIDGKLKLAGSSIKDLTLMAVADLMELDEFFTCTILAGEDLSDEEFNELCDALEEAQPDLELDRQRGDQALYPVVLSLE